MCVRACVPVCVYVCPFDPDTFAYIYLQMPAFADQDKVHFLQNHSI